MESNMLNSPDSLRAAAEAKARALMPGMNSRSAEELLHELRVHQAELEMQNETLRQSQIELEKSRDRYVDFYDFAPVGYITLNHDGMIDEMNLPAATLLGVERGKLLRRRFAAFVASKDTDRWHRHFLSVLRHDSKLSCELALRRGDGTRFYARLDCLRLEVECRKPVVRIVLSDITERKQAEQAMLDMDRRKDAFLAMLAHELRNPLVPICNAAHVLGRMEPTEPRVQWAQKIIEEQAGHLTRMVDDLLDVSRIARNKITLKKESLDLAALIERVAESIRPLAECKKHRLTVRLPRQAVQLEGDPVRLSQVLFNLLDNAIKYTFDGGLIELAAHMAGDEVEISVRDSGMGITAELLPHVFDLFQQDERTVDRAQGGLGIGLTLVQRLVGMHGGQVKAHSEGAGQGSTFTVWLPARAAAEFPGPGVAERSGPVASVRVLVVDDDYDVAGSMAVMLELDGHEVRIVHSGQAVLEMAPVFRPQVVVLDIGLKGMDGFETAKQLRKLTEGRELYLVAMTGYGDEKTRECAMASGCDYFLVKPAPYDELNALLVKMGRR